MANTTIGKLYKKTIFMRFEMPNLNYYIKDGRGNKITNIITGKSKKMPYDEFVHSLDIIVNAENGRVDIKYYREILELIKY